MVVAVLMLGFLAMLGLAADGGAVLAARRDVQDLADASARAGAATINQGGFRQPGTQELVLDQVTAKRAALNYLSQAGRTGDADVTTGALLVDVRLNQTYHTTFSGILGISSVRVQAESQAVPASQRTG